MYDFDYSSFPDIITERLLLRRLNLSDNQAILQIRSNHEIAVHLERTLFSDINEADLFINKINNGIDNKEWLYWGITIHEKHEVIGTICLWHLNILDNTADLGYELLPNFQGLGYIQEAVNAVINFAFQELKLSRVIAEVFEENVKSIKILEKSGFNLANQKQNKWLVYEITN